MTASPSASLADDDRTSRSSAPSDGADVEGVERSSNDELEAVVGYSNTLLSRLRQSRSEIDDFIARQKARAEAARQLEKEVAREEQQALERLVYEFQAVQVDRGVLSPSVLQKGNNGTLQPSSLLSRVEEEAEDEASVATTEDGMTVASCASKMDDAVTVATGKETTSTDDDDDDRSFATTATGSSSSSSFAYIGLGERRQKMRKKQFDIERRIADLHIRNRQAAKELEEARLEEEVHRAKAEEVRRRKQAISDSKRVSIDDLTEGVMKYKMLGLHFSKGAGESMRFTFTQLDPYDTQRQFEVTVGANADSFEIISSDPELPVEFSSSLISKLNSTNDYIPFLCGLRSAFERMVTTESHTEVEKPPEFNTVSL